MHKLLKNINVNFMNLVEHSAFVKGQCVAKNLAKVFKIEKNVINLDLCYVPQNFVHNIITTIPLTYLTLTYLIYQLSNVNITEDSSIAGCISLCISTSSHHNDRLINNCYCSEGTVDRK